MYFIKLISQNQIQLQRLDIFMICKIFAMYNFDVSTLRKLLI